MDIRDHPLAWRWTDKKCARLPDHVLTQILALEAPEAERLFTRSLAFTQDASLSRDTFTVTTIGADGLTKEAGCRWLREREPDLSVRVVASWERNASIRTTWEVFTAYWDDFCYASSDDVLIWPDSESWALLYHHYQEFEFGRRTPLGAR